MLSTKHYIILYSLFPSNYRNYMGISLISYCNPSHRYNHNNQKIKIILLLLSKWSRYSDIPIMIKSKIAIKKSIYFITWINYFIIPIN